MYYGLASATLPLYAKPRAKVKGGCLSCEPCLERHQKECSKKFAANLKLWQRRATTGPESGKKQSDAQETKRDCFLFLERDPKDGPNRQSPIASVQRTRSTPAGHSADPRGTNTTPTNANRAIRTGSATNAGSMRNKLCVFRVNYDRKRTLVIRIAAITLASDSAITLARFRPSKKVTKSDFLTPKVTPK